MNVASGAEWESDQVITEGTGILVEFSDAGTGNQANGEPIRNLASLRLLVRERVLRGMPPLPEGFQLPPGITLDDVLKPPPPFPI